MPGKKSEYLSWKQYFMSTALLAATRSKDPSTRIGACLVNDDNRIISCGYNGASKGFPDDEFPWDSTGEKTNELLKIKNTFVCHAEENAIANCPGSTVGSTMYVSMFPCNECAKLIIQNGIKKVVYLRMYAYSEIVEATKMMFDYAGVVYEPYNRKKEFTKQNITEFAYDLEEMLKKFLD